MTGLEPATLGLIIAGTGAAATAYSALKKPNIPKAATGLDDNEKAARAAAAAAAQRRAALARRGYEGTVLSGPLGAGGGKVIGG